MGYQPQNRNGQNTSANSAPVVIASDQTSIAVTPQGNVASGATDSGNPVKVGGKYSAAVPALSDGQRGDLRLDSSANLNVTLATKLDSINDSITSYPASNLSSYISSATTTICKSGSGHLARIVVGETAAGAITIYDNTAASGTVLGVLKASITEGSYEFDIGFTTGLTIVTAAASKVTVVWR